MYLVFYCLHITTLNSQSRLFSADVISQLLWLSFLSKICMSMISKHLHAALKNTFHILEEILAILTLTQNLLMRARF